MKSLKQTEVVCRDVVELVHEYLEDALVAPERAAFEQHLHACPWCHTYLEQIRATALGVRKLGEQGGTTVGEEASATLPLPKAMEDSLLALFRSRRKP